MRRTNKQAVVPTPTSDELMGIPGLGPTRISALNAMGIATRAKLARASVEQLMSKAGIPRGFAVKAINAAKDVASPSTSPAPPTDEMLPTPGIVGVPTDKPEATAPEPEPAPESDLDRALLTVRTALADASRNFPALEAPLTKLARQAEKLPQRTLKLSDKKRVNIADRLARFTERLEKASSRADDLTKPQRKRLEEQVEAERDALSKAVVPSKPKSKRKGKR